MVYNFQWVQWCNSNYGLTGGKSQIVQGVKLDIASSYDCADPFIYSTGADPL